MFQVICVNEFRSSMRRGITPTLLSPSGVTWRRTWNPTRGRMTTFTTLYTTCSRQGARLKESTILRNFYTFSRAQACHHVLPSLLWAPRHDSLLLWSLVIWHLHNEVLTLVRCSHPLAKWFPLSLFSSRKSRKIALSRMTAVRRHLCKFCPALSKSKKRSLLPHGMALTLTCARNKKCYVIRENRYTTLLPKLYNLCRQPRCVLVPHTRYASPIFLVRFFISTWLVCDSPCIQTRLSRPSITYKTHPLSQAGYKKLRRIRLRRHRSLCPRFHWTFTWVPWITDRRGYSCYFRW